MMPHSQARNRLWVERDSDVSCFAYYLSRWKGSTWLDLNEKPGTESVIHLTCGHSYYASKIVVKSRYKSHSSIPCRPIITQTLTQQPDFPIFHLNNHSSCPTHVKKSSMLPMPISLGPRAPTFQISGQISTLSWMSYSLPGKVTILKTGYFTQLILEFIMFTDTNWIGLHPQGSPPLGKVPQGENQPSSCNGKSRTVARRALCALLVPSL